ncbi:hypothetical protein PENSPDRAFT_748540 [Peniophora sp. CONT]|nr:hypothetical protein PENSPDRAFT_748540 [Peniophora sp. CONT]
MSANPRKQLSSCDRNELMVILRKSPLGVLKACTTALGNILRACGSGAVASSQYDADLRFSASLLDALDIYLGVVLNEPRLSDRHVRDFWEACLSTDFPCTLIRFLGSDILWTHTFDERDSAFGCLCSFMHIWWHGTILTEEGDVRVRKPSRDLVTRIVRESRAVWEMAWQYRAQIIVDSNSVVAGARTGPSRYGVPRYVQNFATSLLKIAEGENQGDDSAIRTLDSSKIAHVVLWTWWFLPFGDAQPDNRAVEAAVTVLLSTPDDALIGRFVDEVIVEEIGADVFLSKLNRSLNELPDVAGDSLSNSLYFMEVFSNANSALAYAYAKLPISTSVAMALRKMHDPQTTLLRGKQMWGERQLRRWGACAGLLVSIGKGLDNGIRAPTTVDGADIYSIFIYGVLIAISVARSGDPSLLNQHEAKYSDAFSQWVEHVRQHNRSKSSLPEAVVCGLRDAARSDGYSVLLELRKASYEPEIPDIIPYLLSVWTDLGKELGVREEEMRKGYEKARNKYCSWRQCKYNDTPSDKALQICKGCGLAFYCTRTCQVSDWKGHKCDCRRLK